MGRREQADHLERKYKQKQRDRCISKKGYAVPTEYGRYLSMRFDSIHNPKYILARKKEWDKLNEKYGN